MSAADRVGELTAQLARITAASSPVEPTRLGVDAALHGRGATLALARQVLGDLNVPEMRRRPDILDLEVKPAAVLAWTLGQQPTIHASQSPTDVARAAAAGSTSAAWERAGATAGDAHLQWAKSLVLPTGAAARAAIADVAVLVQTVAGLDDRLVQAAQQAGAHDVVQALRPRHATGVRLAADAVLHLTAGEELPRWDAMPPLDGRLLGVLPVTDLTQVPRGLHRLGRLLQAGLTVGPGEVASLLSAQARMSALLAARTDRAAQATGAPARAQLATVLTNHMGALAGAWGRSDNALASLDPPDPRPLLQAGECLRALRAHQHSPLPEHLLRQASSLLLQAASATSTCVDSQVRAGLWITSAADENGQGVARTWRTATMTAPPHVSASLAGLRTAARLEKDQFSLPSPWRAERAMETPSRSLRATHRTSAPTVNQPRR